MATGSAQSSRSRRFSSRRRWLSSSEARRAATTWSVSAGMGFGFSFCGCRSVTFAAQGHPDEFVDGHVLDVVVLDVVGGGSAGVVRRCFLRPVGEIQERVEETGPEQGGGRDRGEQGADLVVRRPGRPPGDGGSARPVGYQAGAEVGGDGGGGGVVEDQGRGQPAAGGGAEPVAEFDGGERVEAEVLERLVRVDGPGSAVAEDVGAPAPYQVEQGGEAFLPGRPVSRRRSESASAASAPEAGRRTVPGTRAESRAGTGAVRAAARSRARSILTGTSSGSSRVRAASNSARPSSLPRAAVPPRDMRRRSAAVSVPVMVLRRSHRPQASDWAGSFRARRCWASASRKALAAA